MKRTIKYYVAFGFRFCGFIMSLPAAIMYTISDLIKNKEDEFNF